ncbi:MAG: MaoC family dehydratase N-terminal domain-containing protein [Candidatus Dormibacteraeota bacterium]|uniref:MaoC family dehydratase N-terminal domain-containing protein n=1 Tax=Candidatus Dormiibacter inghamiae TaxID=3127013 RepID=A0A934KC09_9BACT|nr:MaoC family dehydratase N-terminal domain-containing protein [Candidatus Dormibacteraeota bacterium]MBJ7607278.1 MaoC family dehydratase N-terminal domain-containing protein [Candidatus Dormibacteraeota bacterium]
MRERTVTVTRDQIAAYAQASGDHNPIHLDEKFARSVGLPGVIAHGMLQMGLLASVAVEEAGDPRRLSRLSCRFAGMVRPGDEITYRAEANDGGLKLSAVNQNGEAVLSRASAKY